MRASEDDFLRPVEDLAQFGEDTPYRFFQHGVDESTLRRSLVDPFRLGGSTGFVTRAYDAGADRWVEPKWMTAPADAILVIDGRFLGRQRLAGLWNFRIVLDAHASDPADERYRLEEAFGRQSAQAVYDDSDPERPFRRWFDSC
ncbi:hypothetical protein GB864_14480 [Agromyces sp. MMS17-SY077]|uniref:Uridine kinase n=1 Tax=Agromyces seonyuensis TaxID=2662446 RepID=A0A6I4P4D1_9MICO|nr:hypothetical protein [Agromyces seonyuensis]